QDRPTDAFNIVEVIVELDALPTGVTPVLLQQALTSGAIQHDPFNRLLRFAGVMRPGDHDKLLTLSADQKFQATIDRLFVESQGPPVIDPDIIGPDDFRTPVENSPDRTFNIWLERRKFVAKQLNTFTSDPRYTEKVNGVDTPNVSALFSAMYEPVDDDRGTK